MMPRSRSEAASSSSSAAANDAARIARIRPQRLGRQPALRARPLDRAFLADIADQRGKPASQSRPRSLLRHRGLSSNVSVMRTPRV